MGGYISTVEQTEKAKSDEIDRILEEDCQQFKKELKILVLGLGESGKSTIVKQMKIIHQGGFSDSELADYRPVVYKNVLASAQQVVIYMKKIGLECVIHSNRALAKKVLEYRLDMESGSPSFPTEIAEAINQLWKDPIIARIMDEHSSNFYFMDSAIYFFGEVLRIGSPGYLPNETDALHARQKSVGITETKFIMGKLTMRMFDVGCQRSERKKWLHCFESVTSIIFCTALSEYDQVLPEGKTWNRMLESLVLFESVVNSRWFLRTSIILLLTKIDLFQDKLLKVPLERCFPEYTGGPDINKATRYILWKFMQANKARLSVYPHLTQATDKTNIQMVFAVVKEVTLHNVLKDSGIL